MTKHLYLMRHGQTLFNTRRKIQGWCDSPLTELGIRQALAAKDVLKDINFDHYYSSTSERCCDTLELVAGENVSYKRMKGLRERSSGLFEGESEDLNPKKIEDFDVFFSKYGGENFHDVKIRMTHTLNEIMAQEDHECVLAVSSQGAVIIFASSILGEDKISSRFKGGLSNCCVMHFMIEDDKWELVEILNPNIN